MDPVNDAGSLLRVNGNSGGAEANLTGMASDPNSDPLTYSWSLVSTSGTGNVTFLDSASLATTASLDQAGTYILRLTVDDGFAQTTDDVEITVNPPLSSIYTTWAGGSFTHPFTDIDPVIDVDGDSTNNLLEFAFGMDPTVNDSAPLVTDGSVNGAPAPVSSDGGATFDFFFVRRDDHDTSGSLTYTAQFSSDLVTFYDSAANPTFVSDSSDDVGYEVVKTPYPATLPNGQKAIFGRIKVTVKP